MQVYYHYQKITLKKIIFVVHTKQYLATLGLNAINGKSIALLEAKFIIFIK